MTGDVFFVCDPCDGANWLNAAIQLDSSVTISVSERRSVDPRNLTADLSFTLSQQDALDFARWIRRGLEAARDAEALSRAQHMEKAPTDD